MAQELKISVGVWIKLKNEIIPTYRIFIDNELFVERDFIWDQSNTHIKEHLVANLESGEHWMQVRFTNIENDDIEFTKCILAIPDIDPIPWPIEYSPETLGFGCRFEV
jgi:hypothetical protein